jgi:hypothetical protein
MKKRILIFFVPVIIATLLSFKPSDKPGNNNTDNRNTNPNQVLAVTSAQLNANQINTWFRTNGSFNSDPTTDNPGFEWPKGSGKFARYASGLWLGCVVGNDTLIAIADYTFDYAPGYWSSTGAAEGSNDPAYKIYNIYEGNTTSSDYANWPVNQGAYADSSGNPLFLGNQTQFYSYIDYPHTSPASSLASLKAQILQTNWAYNVNGPLGNIVFQEYRIINRSTNVWTKTFLAQWTDDDLGNATDDKAGVDTVLGLGYTYNSTNNDPIYGAAPPAVGFDFFRGALVETGNTDDTVTYYSPPGTENKVVKIGYKDLGMAVFNFYNNNSPQPSDPRSYVEAYRVLQGLWREGNPYIAPGGDTTTFAFSGNPVTNQGWVMSAQNDGRWLQSTGPFDMNPGDTQTIIVAQIIARGSSNLGSITSLKSTDALAQRIFDNNFQVPNSPPVVPTSVYAPGNGQIYLSWSDTAEKVSIPNKLSGSSYRFQGYNIYQIKSGATGSEPADRILMATYDIKDGITDIQDSLFNNDYGTYIYYVVQEGSDNGISRYFVMDRDYEGNTLLYNGTQYRVVVTAYYYDSLGGPFSAPKVAESPITSTNIQQVIPQNLTLGTVVYYNVGDTIPTNQMDLGSMPIIISPLNLITASYQSTYGEVSGSVVWNLERTIGGNKTILLTNQTDFTGTQDTAFTIDGFIMVHTTIIDSGIVLDENDPVAAANNVPTYTNTGAWTYSPANSQWFTGPDTTAIANASLSSSKIIKKQFQSRSLGMSWPYSQSFRNSFTRVKANGTNFTPAGGANDPMLNGGPLRTIKMVFGENSMAYRYANGNNVNVLTTDTNLALTPYKDMVSIPFSVYAAENLDSSGGALRKLNVAFIDADASGTWNPDGSELGGFEYTYILASSYSETPAAIYQAKSPGLAGGANGFTSMDIMYAWLPRRNTVNGAPLTWTTGDTLTVSPYVITRPNFVPGYPVKYAWTVNGTQIANQTIAQDNLSEVNAYPNPYYGTSRLETDPFDRFIYISHLPQVCNIYIYSLDGTLINSIQRNNQNPNNSLEKWNMQNASQIPVASGMYIIVVDAGSIGVKTLKVAIFTPEERLDTF